MEQLSEPDTPLDRKLEALNKLAESGGGVSEFHSNDEIISTLRPYLLDSHRTLRTACLRVFRILCNNEDFIEDMVNHKVHFFVAQALYQDRAYEAERVQALKLIRKIMEINCDLLPRLIAFALVSIADNRQDNLCLAALETLCELAIRNPKLAAQCSAIRQMIISVLDPIFVSTQNQILLSLLYLVNSKQNRKYIDFSYDIWKILHPLTDNLFPLASLQPSESTPRNESDKESEERERLIGKWNLSLTAVFQMLKSWPGLIMMNSSELGLRSLIETFKLPNTELHEMLIDEIFKVFRLEKNSETKEYFANKAQSETKISSSSGWGWAEGVQLHKNRQNLLRNYLAALLLAFIDAGLIDGLIEIIKKYSTDTQSNLITKATLLLGEILHISDQLFPPSRCGRIQALPALVELAASFKQNGIFRNRATTTVTNLNLYHHTKHSLSQDSEPQRVGWNEHDPNLTQKEKLRKNLEASIDLESLKKKIDDIQFSHKDWIKWKWDVIEDLLDGHLTVPSLMQFTLSKTHFVKKLLNFFKPSGPFSSLLDDQENAKYARMMYQLFGLLLVSEAGCQAIQESKFLEELVNALGKLQEKTSVFSKDALLKTMSREYFRVIGLISHTERGVTILSKSMVFGALKGIVDYDHNLHSRIDLVNFILKYLDYTSHQDARLILNLILNNQVLVRFYAVKQLGILAASDAKDFANWGVEMLASKVMDQEFKVARVALEILDDICYSNVNAIKTLVRLHSNWLSTPHQRLEKMGKNVWLRLLSTKEGVALLTGKTPSEMELWKNKHPSEMNLWKYKLNGEYALELERVLSEVLNPSLFKENDLSVGDSVIVPPHFYGELAKTKEGCEILTESGHIQEFIQTITEVSDQPDLDVYGALWALGHIASSTQGYQNFFNESLIKQFVTIAETHPSFSLRGTCSFVLGMMSQVPAVNSLLNSLGWESASFICLPKRGTQNPFFLVTPEPYEGSLANRATPLDYPDDDEDTVQREILDALANLSNFIVADSASHVLANLRNRYPNHFSSPFLLVQVFKLLSMYTFPLVAVRFIFKLFSISNPDQIFWEILDKSE